jgi:hypothetical protein
MNRCAQKVQYRTAEDAEEVRARQQLLAEDVLRVYSCEDCGAWHLTHGRLSAVQIRDAQRELLTNLERYLRAERQLKAFMQALYTRRACYRSRRDLEADLARAEDAMDQLGWLWQAWFWGDVALRRSQATSADQARQMDREARVRWLQHVEMRERHRQVSHQRAQAHLALFEARLNTTIRLPYQQSPLRAAQTPHPQRG